MKFIPAIVPLVFLALAPVALRAATGDEIFEEHCASCHGVNGKGRTPIGKKLGLKDLAERKLSDAELTRRILDGTKDAKGLTRMPAFKDKLSAAEIADVIVHLKCLRSSREEGAARKD